MIADIDRATVLTIVELDDAVRAAEARRVAARGGPAPCVLSLDDDLLPTKLTPEEQLLHDRLGELDRHAMARVLALYWFGRQASWDQVDEEFYRAMLAQAEHDLDNTPWYLTAKPDLGKRIRTAMAILDL